VGKEAQLACGYSMGAAKFASRCAAQGLDLAAAGVTAEQVVEEYRGSYPTIAGRTVSANGRIWRKGGLWKDVEEAARAAIQTGKKISAGRCLFYRDGAALVIELPSSRRLYYRNARVENLVPAYCATLGLPEQAKPTVVFDSPKEPATTTYGGMLVENIVQAICRDLLVTRAAAMRARRTSRRDARP